MGMKEEKVSRRFFSSLRFKLLLVVMLALLPAFGFFIYTSLEQRQDAADSAYENANQLADLIAAEQEQLVEGARQLLATLAQIPAVREADLAAIKEIFADVIEQTPPYDNASLVDIEGNLLVSVLDPGGPVNIIDRPYFQEVLRTRDFTMGDYLISKVTGTPIVLFTYPLLDEEGQVYGVVSTRINLNWLSEFITGVDLPPDSVLTVVDRNGIILARDPDPEGYVGRTLTEEPFVQAILGQPEGGMVHVEGLDGVRRLYTFAPLFSDRGRDVAYVIIGFSEDVIYSEANQAITRNLIILGLVTLLILVLAWVLSDVFVLGRVKKLVDTTKRLGGGDLGTRSDISYGSGELGRLASSFDEMAESLQRRSEERDRAEGSLKSNEERLSGVMEAVPVGIVIVDREGTIVFANTMAEEILGLERSAISGRTYADPAWRITAVDGGPFPEEELAISRAMNTREEVRGVEHAIEQPDGTRVIISINAAPLLDTEGNLTGAVASLMDTTERRQAEQELRDSQTMVQRIVDTTPNIIFIYDLRERRNIYISRNAYEQLGYSPQQIRDMGESVIEKVIHPDDRGMVAEYFGRLSVAKEGEIIDLEYRQINASGKSRWFYSRATVFSRDDEGMPVQALGEVQDITETRRAKRELEISETGFRELFENMNSGVAVYEVRDKGSDFVFKDFNRAAERIEKVAREELIGKSVLEVFPAVKEFGLFDVFQRVSETGNPEHFPITLYRDERISGWRDNYIYRLPSGEIVAIYDDVTERKWAEREIQRAMERLRSLREIDMGILEARSPGETARTALKHLRRLIPYRRAAVVLIDMASQEAEILSSDADDATSIRPGTTFSFIGSAMIETLRKGEMIVIDDIDSVPKPHPAYVQLRAEGIRSGLYIPLIAHGELVGALGMESEKPGAFSTVDIDIDIGGEVASHLAVALYNARLFDQVQRHADELEQRVTERTTQLEAANRELEAFSYSISHDLRAPLRGIDGFSQALLEDYYDKLDEQARDYLRRVRAASQRMAQLIDDILGLSRVTRGDIKRETVDLSALAARIMEELRARDPAHGVDFTAEPGMEASGDPVLLRVALTNLLDNAFKFTAGKEDARIEFGRQERDGRWVFFVRDNGVGFDMKYAGKLFGVFQRLHAVTEFPGTGIGLATVQRVIHRHGGEVWGEGEVGEGAVFYFTLVE